MRYVKWRISIHTNAQNHIMRWEKNKKSVFFPRTYFCGNYFCRKFSHKRPIILWERHNTHIHTHIHQNSIQQMLMATMRNPIANTHYTQTKRVDHDIEKFNTSLNKFEFGSHKTDTWEIKQSIISSLFLPAIPNANRLLCFFIRIKHFVLDYTENNAHQNHNKNGFILHPNVSLASEKKKNTPNIFFNKFLLQFEL